MFYNLCIIIKTLTDIERELQVEILFIHHKGGRKRIVSKYIKWLICEWSYNLQKNERIRQNSACAQQLIVCDSTCSVHSFVLIPNLLMLCPHRICSNVEKSYLKLANALQCTERKMWKALMANGQTKFNTSGQKHVGVGGLHY
jgi:hypothetical protein